MTPEKLAAEGLNLQFRVEHNRVCFIGDNGKERTGRPATWTEIRMWEALQRSLSEGKQQRAVIAEMDKQLANWQKDQTSLVLALRKVPGIEPDSLLHPISMARDFISGFVVLAEESNNFSEWLDEEFPGELNETEGLYGTIRRLLRKMKSGGTPKQARQRGGQAIREAQEASPKPLARPIKDAPQA